MKSGPDGAWLNWATAHAAGESLQPLWRRLFIRVVLTQTTVFTTWTGWPAGPYDLYFLTRIFIRILEDKSTLEAALSVHVEQPQDWRSALVVPDSAKWLRRADAIEQTTGARGVTGALQFVVFDSLRKIIDVGETPAAPFDLAFLASTVAGLAESRATLSAVLAGEDIRWWPEDDP